MTPEQIKLVQESFQEVGFQSDAAATIFYHRLFTLQPTLRLMFPADLTEQKQKLMKTLGFAVGSLTKLDALVPALAALGRNHALYGVKDEHYALVGSALIWTLNELLGAEVFTRETAIAWTKMYEIVADVMQQAAGGYLPESENESFGAHAAVSANTQIPENPALAF